jgi:hypothetical protein
MTAPTSALSTRGRARFRMPAVVMAVALALAPSVAAQPREGASASSAATTADKTAGNVRQLRIANRPWTGDFDRMLERRVIRNLTVTDERLRRVDFVPGDEGRRTISEVIVQ